MDENQDDKFTLARNCIKSVADDGMEHYARFYVQHSMNVLRNDADEGLDID